MMCVASESQQEQLIVLNEVVCLEGTNPHNPNLLELSDLSHPLLNQLLQLVLQACYLTLLLNKETINIYLLHLYHQNTGWFVEGIEKSSPCGKIVDSRVYQGKLWGAKKINQLSHTSSEKLVLTIGPKAIEQFKKYHPFSLLLTFTDSFQKTAILRTTIDDSEETLEEISKWLLFLGRDIKFQKTPENLWKKMQETVSSFNSDLKIIYQLEIFMLLSGKTGEFSQSMQTCQDRLFILNPKKIQERWGNCSLFCFLLIN